MADPVFEQWGSDSGEQAPLRITVRPKGTEATFERWGGPLDRAIETGKGLYNALDTGVAKGAAGLIGLPNAVASIGAAGIDKASRAVADLIGVEYERPKVDSPLQGVLPTYESALDTIKRDYYDGKPLYEPQNRMEKFAERAGEFGVGGIGSSWRNFIKYALAPSVGSEAAGQATEGGPLETPARIAGALATGGIAALASRPGTAAQAIRNQMPAGVTDQMVTQAERLIADAARQGVTLSWPEALSQVAGRPVLSNLARHLEAAPATEARMAEFYGARPQQVENAGRVAMDRIGPPNYAPSTIGPQAGQVAEQVGHDMRQAINAAADPYYTAAQRHLLGPAEMARVQALPGYAAARDAVLNDPQLARYVAGLPENSVGFLNEVKKQLDYQGRNAAAPMGPQGIPNQQRVAGFERDAAATRQAAIDASGGATGPYAAALHIEEEGRRRFLDPLMQGPIGKLADRNKETRAAIEALFPSNPLPNSAREISTAVGAMAQRSPRVAQDLVRAHVESVFNEATQALQAGANQAGGAKFWATLVGNPQQAANLEAAVRALPNGAARWQGFQRFLDVMEATGTRQNIGSKTAYNAEFLKEAASSGIPGEVVKGATNPISRFTQGLVDKYERWRLGQNLNELADILTNPGAVQQLQQIARLPVNSRQAEVVAWRLTNMIRSANAGSSTPAQSRP